MAYVLIIIVVYRSFQAVTGEAAGDEVGELIA
jgi:hypothetical protein